MKKLVFVLALSFHSFTFAQAPADKRALILESYAENLPAFWKTMENVPPDFMLSSLAIALPGGVESAEKTKVALMYKAAIMAMEGAMAEIRELGKCLKTVEKYKAQFKSWGPDNANCKELFVDFSTSSEIVLKVNEKIAREKIDYRSDLSAIERASDYSWIDNFLFKFKNSCGNSGPVQKSANDDLENSCKDLLEVVLKDRAQRWSYVQARINQPRNKMKHIRTGHGEDNSCPPGQLSQPYTPLYFSDMILRSGGKECGGSSFAGIFKGERELLLINSRWRAFYWMMMAEKMDEGLKKMSFANTDDLSNYKLEGSVPCNSPIDDNQKCVPFAAFLKSLVAEKKYFEDGRDVQDVAVLGDGYNSKRVLSLAEKDALNRLAKNLQILRDMARNHKSALRNTLEYEKLPLKLERIELK